MRINKNGDELLVVILCKTEVLAAEVVTGGGGRGEEVDQWFLELYKVSKRWG